MHGQGGTLTWDNWIGEPDSQTTQPECLHFYSFNPYFTYLCKVMAILLFTVNRWELEALYCWYRCADCTQGET